MHLCKEKVINNIRLLINQKIKIQVPIPPIVEGLGRIFNPFHTKNEVNSNIWNHRDSWVLLFYYYIFFRDSWFIFLFYKKIIVIPEFLILMFFLILFPTCRELWIIIPDLNPNTRFSDSMCSLPKYKYLIYRLALQSSTLQKKPPSPPQPWRFPIWRQSLVWFRLYQRISMLY